MFFASGYGMRSNSPIILIIRLLLLLACFPPFAAVATAVADSAVEEAQNRFFARVNEARRDPIGQAIAFGVDTDALFLERPWLLNVIAAGLTPLTRDDAVNSAAAGHTADMLARNYYAEQSPDGKKPLDRIRDAGVPAGSAGEALGMITFVNFMPPQTAGDLLFRNLFLRDFLSAPPEALTLLSPVFSLAGVSIRGGVMTESGMKKNAYLVCFDAAETAIQGCEPELIEMINEFRRSPVETARMLGIADELMLSDENGLPPLAINEPLTRVAMAQGEYILSSGDLSGEAPERGTPFERAQESGYGPAFAMEAGRVLLSVIPMAPCDAAREILSRLIRRELADAAEKRVLLNPQAWDIGIHFKYETPEDDFIPADYLSGFYNAVLVIETAAPEAGSATGPYLIGTAFKDLNDDGLYGYAEGVGGLAVIVTDMDTAGSEVLMRTNNAGGFVFKASKGRRYAISLGDEPPLFINAAGDNNLSVIFQLSPEAP